MDDEAEVGLVEAHAQGAGGHERLDAVGLEIGLEALALGGLGLAGVGGHLQSGGAQGLRGLARGGDGEAVDDPGALGALEVSREPGQPGGSVLQARHAQVEGIPLEAPAQDEHLGGGPTHRAPRQLLGHIRGDALVGGGRRRQDGGEGGQACEQGADAPVVRPEIVAPVRDAVGLIDDDEARAGRQVRQDLVPEDGVVEALGRDQEDIGAPGADLGLDLLPLGAVGRVHGDGPDAGALGGGDLIAHEGQQRGDDDRRTGAVCPLAGAGQGEGV